MADEKKQNGPTGAEIKQSVITPADAKASTPRKLRFPGFAGSYKSARFGDDGISEAPVAPEVEAELRAQFPGAKIEEVKE